MSLSPIWKQAGVAVGRSSNGTLAPTLPTRVNHGDLCFLFAYADTAALAITTDGGGAWTTLSGSPFGATEKLYVWYRIHNDSTPDSAPTLTASGQAAAMTNLAYTACYERDTFDPTTPIDVVGTASTGSSTTPNNAGATTVTSGALAIHLFGLGDDGTVSGWTFGATSATERADTSTTQGNDASLAHADLLFAASGATGAASTTSTTTSPWVSVTFGIRPNPTTPAVRFIGKVEGPGNSTTSSVVITVNQDVPVGDRVVVVAAGGGSQPLSTVTDSRGNTYTEHVDTLNGRYASIASSVITTGLQIGDTITITWAGNGSVGGAGAIAASGYGSATVDTALGSGAATQTWSTGTVARGTAKALLVGLGVFVAGSSNSMLPASGWTEFFEGSNAASAGNTNGEGIYKEVTTTGTEGASGTTAGAAQTFAAGLVVFYESSIVNHKPLTLLGVG